jgi:serine/threonine protein kinase
MSKIFTIAEGLENMGAMRTGGQGSVYKGKRIGPIITAVKIIPTPIHSENIEDKNYRTFLNEVEKLKKVNEVPNPNVVKILNSGLTESGSFPFIEMEYIEGPDLEELLKAPHNPIFTIKETIKLAEQLANALAHCHAVGVKHGDIKSNNVKFNIATGNYILLDFGLAIMSDEQRRSSVRHAGAVEFMAPEQHDGEMFFQTDVYSFGVVLYELLAGSVPFPLINKGENSRNSVMLSHMEKALPDLLTLRRNHLPESWTPEVQEKEMNIPSWLLVVINKCLEKAPEKRYANGTYLKDAIANSTHENISSPVPAFNPPVEKAPDLVENDNSKVTISKPVFILMIVGIIGFALLSAYPYVFKENVEKNLVSLDSSVVKPQDSTSIAEDVPEDTATQIKPILLDTAVQDTNIDSLKKEYERQQGISAKAATAATKPEKEKVESVIVSEGKKYKMPKSAIYFYDAPEAGSPKHGVIGLWVNTKFDVVDEQNGFIYVTHTDNDNQVTKGWINKNDLTEVQ